MKWSSSNPSNRCMKIFSKPKPSSSSRKTSQSIGKRPCARNSQKNWTLFPQWKRLFLSLKSAHKVMTFSSSCSNGNWRNSKVWHSSRSSCKGKTWREGSTTSFVWTMRTIRMRKSKGKRKSRSSMWRAGRNSETRGTFTWAKTTPKCMRPTTRSFQPRTRKKWTSGKTTWGSCWSPSTRKQLWRTFSPSPRDTAKSRSMRIAIQNFQE